MDHSNAFREFLNNCKNRGLSKRTHRAYLCDLSKFEKWIAREGISMIDKIVVRRWISDMRMRKLAPATIKRRIACLKTTFRWLVEEGSLQVNPFHNFRTEIRIPKTLPKSLTRSEMSAIFKQAASDARNLKRISKFTIWLALEILFSTGIRVSELCDIRLDDLDTLFINIFLN